ncbi:hypothetical protein ACHAPF_006208 [Botrytis cinerea]
MDASHPETKLRYRPLVSKTAIRLVMIHPGPRDDLIRCHLIDDSPTIGVSDKDVIVRKNLHDVLVQIRLSEAERHIWIGALSINQSDIKERNAQIEIMGQIYSGVSVAIVLLGNAAENSDTTYRILKEMAAQTVLETTDKMTYQELLNHIELVKVFDSFNHEDRKALVALSQRPYWSRIWISQKLHLAKSYEVYCGDKCITVRDFQISIGLL